MEEEIWKKAITKNLTHMFIPAFPPFPSMHIIEIDDKSIQISFKYNDDSRSFVDSIEAIGSLLKIQGEKENEVIGNSFGLTFLPHDPKFSSVINDFPSKPNTLPSSNFVPLSFQPIKLNTIDSKVSVKNQGNQRSLEHGLKIKMIVSDLPPSVQLPFITPKTSEPIDLSKGSILAPCFL